MASYLNFWKKDVEKVITITESFYHKCSQISEHSNNNLVGLFFHEIIRYFSTIIVQRHIINHRDSDVGDFLNQNIRFGYRGKLSIYNHSLKLNKKRKFISLISKLPFLKNRPAVHLGDVSINNYKIIFYSYFRGYKVVYQEPNTKVFIERYDMQYQLIMELIRKLCAEFSIDFDKALLTDIKNSQSIVSQQISSISMFSQRDIVIIGSPGKVLNRIYSVNAHYLNLKVIGVLHSDASGSDNNPSWIYDDWSNSSHLIGYGQYGDYLLNKENNFLTLNRNSPIYIQSDSEVCRSVYNESKEISELCDYSKIIKQKGLYVSMRIGDISVINPYPVMDPIDYIKWQKFLLSKFPKVFVKRHPKQAYTISYNNEVEVKKNLVEILDELEYDFFIVDSVKSTAFSLIASSSKPIIYFNIEQPCLTNKALISIKKRVLWIDIDIFSDYKGFEIYQQLKASYKFQNTYTSMFSLSENKVSRISALLGEI